MAVVYTFDERNTLIQNVQDILDQMVSLNNDIKDYRDNLLDTVASGVESYPTVETQITNLLADLDYLRDRAVTELGYITLTYDNTVYPTPYREYTTCAVDVDNGSSKGVLTADGGYAFQVYDAGDTVEISNAADSDNDGIYTVDSSTDTTLTLTTVLGAAGDTASDTGIIVTLKAR